jgi:L-2-hydroxyglutarate oxidase
LRRNHLWPSIRPDTIPGFYIQVFITNPVLSKRLIVETASKRWNNFARNRGFEHELCGKIIVALNDDEVPRMQNIFQRGQENGVNCKIISREEMLEIEPHVAGVQAIHVPECGIVNYKQVCLRLGEIIQKKEENKIFLGHQVTKIRNMDNQSCG